MGCGERDKERSRVSKKGGRSAPVFPRLSIVSRASRELRERAFQQLKDFVRVPHKPTARPSLCAPILLGLASHAGLIAYGVNDPCS